MTRICLLKILAGLLVFGLSVGNFAVAQSSSPELLLTGDEYNQADLPANPAGTWWVLHRPSGETELEALQVVVTKSNSCGGDQSEDQRGRAVSVPAASKPIMLVRAHPDLGAGPVRTTFLDDGYAGETDRIEAPWGDETVIVRHITKQPVGDQPWEYRIELTVSDRQFQLHTDQWHGDGHWRVRWIGDLNRDGWPDLLLDASYKYSIYTTRLYLSHKPDGRLEFNEVATFSHTAC